MHELSHRNFLGHSIVHVVDNDDKVMLILNYSLGYIQCTFNREVIFGTLLGDLLIQVCDMAALDRFHCTRIVLPNYGVNGWTALL